jgi:hypothetical protein
VAGQRIAMDVKPSVIFERGISPSFAELRSLGFTDVGTDLDPGMLDDLSGRFILLNWLNDAHKHGFRVFASIGSNSSLRQVGMAIALGFDYVEFDEFLSGYFMNETDFESFLRSVIQLYPAQILVTEYSDWAFDSALLFARQYLDRITVASDDYQNISSLSRVYRAGQASGVNVAAWIIFIPDSSNAYVNLRSWIFEALALGLSIYFYAVLPEGTWTVNWPILKDQLKMRQMSLFFSATEQTVTVTSLVLVAWFACSFALQIIKSSQTKKMIHVHLTSIMNRQFVAITTKQAQSWAGNASCEIFA